MKIRWWKKGGKSNNKQKIWPSGTQRNRRERRAEYLGGNMFRGILPPHLHHKVGTIFWLPLTPLRFPSESQSPNAQLHVSSVTPPAPPLDPGATGDSDPRPRAHPPHRRSFQAWDRILQRETGMDSVPHNLAGPLPPSPHTPTDRHPRRQTHWLQARSTVMAKRSSLLAAPGEPSPN